MDSEPGDGKVAGSRLQSANLAMEASLAIVVAQVIDGVSSTPIHSGAVLISTDGRVAAVGSSHEVDIPDRAPTICSQATHCLTSGPCGGLRWCSGTDTLSPAMDTSCSREAILPRSTHANDRRSASPGAQHEIG